MYNQDKFKLSTGILTTNFLLSFRLHIHVVHNKIPNTNSTSILTVGIC